MKLKEQKTVNENGAKKGKSVVDLKLEMLSELAATVQDEVNSLSAYMSTYTFSNQSDSFDLRKGINLAEEIRRVEIELITHALRYTGGHQLNAARLLGMKPTTLNAKIKLFGISTSL